MTINLEDVRLAIESAERPKQVADSAIFTAEQAERHGVRDGDVVATYRDGRATWARVRIVGQTAV